MLLLCYPRNDSEGRLGLINSLINIIMSGLRFGLKGRFH